MGGNTPEPSVKGGQKPGSMAPAFQVDRFKGTRVLGPQGQDEPQKASCTGPECGSQGDTGQLTPACGRFSPWDNRCVCAHACVRGEGGSSSRRLWLEEACRMARSPASSLALPPASWGSPGTGRWAAKATGVHCSQCPCKGPRGSEVAGQDSWIIQEQLQRDKKLSDEQNK